MNDATPPDNMLTGLEVLRRYMQRERSAPLGNLLGFYLVEVGDGYAVFEGTPTLAHYNPHGSVHGGWSAAMLDIGPARLAHAGHVKAVALADEAGLTLAQHVVVILAAFHGRVAGSAAERLLHLAHGFRECKLCEPVTHDGSPPI